MDDSSSSSSFILHNYFVFYLITNDDVVDRYVDEFYEESNESHDAESNGCGDSDLLELPTVGFRASFDKSEGIFGESTSGLIYFQDLIHFN